MKSFGIFVSLLVNNHLWSPSLSFSYKYNCVHVDTRLIFFGTCKYNGIWDTVICNWERTYDGNLAKCLIILYIVVVNIPYKRNYLRTDYMMFMFRLKFTNVSGCYKLRNTPTPNLTIHGTSRFCGWTTNHIYPVFNNCYQRIFGQLTSVQVSVCIFIILICSRPGLGLSRSS